MLIANLRYAIPGQNRPKFKAPVGLTITAYLLTIELLYPRSGFGVYSIPSRLSTKKYNILWLKEIKALGLCTKSKRFVTPSYSRFGHFVQLIFLHKKSFLDGRLYV